jgi:hypothetical protein
MWKRALQMTVKEAKRSVVCEEERQIQRTSDKEDKPQIIQQLTECKLFKIERHQPVQNHPLLDGQDFKEYMTR